MSRRSSAHSPQPQSRVRSQPVPEVLVWYHGSQRCFDAFDLDHIGGDKGNDSDGPGFYLTSSPDDAKIYVGDNGGVASVVFSPRRLVPRHGLVSYELLADLIMAAPDFMAVLSSWEGGITEAVNSYVEHNFNRPLDACLNVWADFYHRAGKRGDHEFLNQMVLAGYDGHTQLLRDSIIHAVAYTPKRLTITGWDR